MQDTMKRTRFRRILAACTLAGALCGVPHATAQTAKATRHPAAAERVEAPDAQRTREELSELLQRHPPGLRSVLALDATLLANPAYLEPYPALRIFLEGHPEIARDPSFFIGAPANSRTPADPSLRVYELWRHVLEGLSVFAGFGMAMSLLVWLIRTAIDYRRWSRLSRVQTEVHTKLLDRFSANSELLSYMQSPAGSKFLESSPISLDAAPRSLGAPLGRIMWSIQGGVVLLAGGIGFMVISGRVDPAGAQPLHAIGVLAVALGLGFVISAIISYVISQRLGLIEPPSAPPREDAPGV
jgi:hypothetical protein